MIARKMLRIFLDEINTPTQNEGWYFILLQAIAHAFLGFSSMYYLGLSSLTVALIYAVAKEVPDFFFRRGKWRDGVEDTFFVWAGAFASIYLLTLALLVRLGVSLYREATK